MIPHKRYRLIPLGKILRYSLIRPWHVNLAVDKNNVSICHPVFLFFFLISIFGKKLSIVATKIHRIYVLRIRRRKDVYNLSIKYLNIIPRFSRLEKYCYPLVRS